MKESAPVEDMETLPIFSVVTDDTVRNQEESFDARLESSSTTPTTEMITTETESILESETTVAVTTDTPDGNTEKISDSDDFSNELD